MFKKRKLNANFEVDGIVTPIIPHCQGTPDWLAWEANVSLLSFAGRPAYYCCPNIFSSSLSWVGPAAGAGQCIALPGLWFKCGPTLLEQLLSHGWGDSRHRWIWAHPTTTGCQVWEQSHCLSTTPRVCHPASPSSACMAATISGGMTERRRKSIPFLYSDILYSCTNLASLSAENRKRWAKWQKLLKPFNCNDILTKDEITQHLWGFHVHTQHFFTLLV